MLLLAPQALTQCFDFDHYLSLHGVDSIRLLTGVETHVTLCYTCRRGAVPAYSLPADGHWSQSADRLRNVQHS
jgi:hypothetical protein